MNIAYLGKSYNELLRTLRENQHDVRHPWNIPERDWADTVIFFANIDSFAGWQAGFANTPDLAFLRGWYNRPLIVLFNMPEDEFFHPGHFPSQNPKQRDPQIVWANQDIRQEGYEWKRHTPSVETIMSLLKLEHWHFPAVFQPNFFVPYAWENPPADKKNPDGTPVHHPGAFGATRRHDIHTGVDLYGKPGDKVYPFLPGVVESIHDFTGPDARGRDGKPLDWWLPTKAVTVRRGSQYLVYGEIMPNPNLKVGDKVTTRDPIGTLTPVLPPHKHRPDIPNHSTTMLHLEWWQGRWDPRWDTWHHGEPRPVGLKDPTRRLLALSRRAPQTSGLDD